MALAAACRDPHVAQAGLELDAPAELVFAPTYAGFSRTQGFTVVSRSRFAVTLAVESAAPFSAPAQLELPAGAAVSVPVTFGPDAVGHHAGALALKVDGQSVTVALSGEGLEVPTCTASVQCTASRFDPERGCVEEPADEGASCRGGSCLQGARCRSGVCMGTAVSCDDANACTADACSEEGCLHGPIECPSSADPCRAASCDPVTGCGMSPVADGTSCGANDCLTAHVCMAGTCVERPAPDGSRCGAPTLCRAEGRCVSGACEPPAAGAPSPRWRWQPPAGTSLMRVAVDANGNSYAFVGDGVRAQYDAGAPYQLRLVSLDRSGQQRWSVNLSAQRPGLENGVALMVDPDSTRLYLGARSYNYGTEVSPRAVVAQARDTATGALLWEHDLMPGITAYSPASDGTLRLDVQRLMMLNGGDLGLMLSEGDSLHQAYFVGLARATGAQLWRVQRDGHAGVALTGNGELWDVSAGCWSTVSYLGHLDATGADLGRWQSSLRPFAYGRDEIVVPDDAGMALMSGAWARRAVPLPAGHSLPWDPSVRLDGERVTWLTQSPTGMNVTRYDVGRAAAEWSVPTPQGTTSGQLRLLGDGGVMVSTGQSDGGVNLAVLRDDGSRVEQCRLFAPFAIAAGLYFVQTSGLEAYGAPGIVQQPYGWPAWDGVGSTQRAR